MKFHAFFSHDWNLDAHDRNNHIRVLHVMSECKKRGLKIAPEPDAPTKGNIVDRLWEGIDGSPVVVVFLTKNYIDKVAQQERGDDVCKLEFSYALRRHQPSNFIAVVMEESVRSPTEWKSPIGTNLHNNFIDMSEGELPSSEKCEELADTIKRSIIKVNNESSSDTSTTSGFHTPHTILFTNTKYVGKIISGTVAHGVGEFYCLEGKAKGNKYVGEFSGTIPDGQGRFTFADGEVYEGEYRNGRKNGQGTYFFNSGARYTGGYCDGKKHGRGVYKSKDGDVYEGEYKMGKKHGQGVMRYASGDKYEGSYDEDKKQGQGKYTFKDGGVYQGEYHNDKKHGQGRYVWPNGDLYVGEYKDGKKHGYGKMTYANGKVQQGSWVEGNFKN